MKTSQLTLLLMFILPLSLFGQKYTISGYISDKATGEKLIGANVYDLKTLQGTTTNNYGFFSLTLPADSVHLTVSYIGYNAYSNQMLLNKDMQLNISLSSALELEQIEVTAEMTERIEERTQMSTISIPIQQIKALPAFMGEVDILKALQLLPGVQSGNEGASGLYVRGGSPDQNLILLDGVPVYNVSHLFGFFSVFNADAINNVQLIKGGFPARYGGRLSSVLEINMKEGNSQEFHGEGSVGLIASKLTLEGPIVKDKASFIISGRRTYYDILAQPFILMATDGAGTGGYYFYDLNAKVNYKISDKDRLYLSAYMGDDKFYFKDKYTEGDYTNKVDGKLRWGNTTAVLRWNHQFNKKLFSNTTLNFSKYKFLTSASNETIDKVNGKTETTSYLLQYFSGIQDWSTKVDFDFIPAPNHFVKFGASAIWHKFEPGATQFKLNFIGEQLDTTIANQTVNAGEFAVYIEDDMKISNRLKANIGLHASGFSVNDEFYKSLQPRASLRFLINENLSFKASYAAMAQYIHLLTNSGIGLPTDLWVPATEKIRPQNSHQVAAGLARTFMDKYEVSLEGYYKQMNNIIEYKDGASFLSTDRDWQNKVEPGTGWSYGSELFIQKKTGNTTGWIGYTLSWTNRQFEEINFGEIFPYKYDRRHDISVVVIHKINDNIEISGTWVYGTGNAVTLPLQRYPSTSEGIDFEDFFYELEYYKERNGYRMRDYHRLDLGVTFKKERRWGESAWNFSVYNAYNRKNPFFIYYTSDGKKPVFKQVSLFPIIPSVSYSFKF